jgi:hypothetical protein
MAAHKIGSHVRLNRVQSHGVPSRVMQGQGDEIDVYHSGKALGEISNKFVDVAVRGDRLRNL